MVLLKNQKKQVRIHQGGHFLLQITRFKLLFWICLESNLGGYLYNLKWIGALLYPPTTPPCSQGVGGWFFGKISSFYHNF